MRTDDGAEDAFGFASLAATKDKIKQIKPTPVTEHDDDLSRVDAVADSIGFVSREARSLQEPAYAAPLRAGRAEPRIPLNMRVPVSLGGAFQRFCEEERYSYPEALAEVMKRAGLPLK